MSDFRAEQLKGGALVNMSSNLAFLALTSSQPKLNSFVITNYNFY